MLFRRALHLARGKRMSEQGARVRLLPQFTFGQTSVLAAEMRTALGTAAGSKDSAGTWARS